VGATYNGWQLYECEGLLQGEAHSLCEVRPLASGEERPTIRTMRRWPIPVILGLLAAPQAPSTYQVPLWTGVTWNYVSLGSSLSVSGGRLSIAPAASDIWRLAEPQGAFPLRCLPADLYLNGLLQTEGGVDYSVSGLAASFNAASTPQAGDVVKAVYRCAP